MNNGQYFPHPLKWFMNLLKKKKIQRFVYEKEEKKVSRRLEVTMFEGEWCVAASKALVNDSPANSTNDDKNDNTNSDDSSLQGDVRPMLEAINGRDAADVSVVLLVVVFSIIGDNGFSLQDNSYSECNNIYNTSTLVYLLLQMVSNELIQ